MMGKHAGPNEVVHKALPFTSPRKFVPEKQTLAEILEGLDVLDNSNYTPEERKIVENAQGDATFSYDEWIPAGLASTLLGKDFDPKCRYKLITQLDATTVLKIDDRIPENAKPVLDEHGKIVSAHTVEYVLHEDRENFDVGQLPESVIRQDITPEVKKHRLGFTAIFGITMISLVLVWLVIMLYIVAHGGM